MVKSEHYVNTQNSPNLNVLDLPIFIAIQNLQNEYHSTASSRIDRTRENVFKFYPPENISNVFLTLQFELESSISDHGVNNFIAQNPWVCEWGKS